MGYIYKLMLKADLIKCTNMQMNDGFNDPFTEYKFKLTCVRCGVQVDANVSFATEVLFQPSNDEEEEDESEEMSIEENTILAGLNAAADNNASVHFNHACACCCRRMCIKMIPIENGIGLTDSPNDTTTLMKFFIEGAIPSKYQADKSTWQVTRLVDDTLHAFSLECDQEEEEEEEDEAYISYSYSSGDAFSSIYLEIANAKFYFTREA